MVVPIARLYILRVFAKFFLLSLFVFASLFMMLNFVQMVNQGILGGFSLYFLAKSMFYLSPNIFGASMPLAFLLAMLLSLGQMSQDGELIALRAGGFSFYDIFSWIFVAALFCSLLLAAINNWAGPKGLKRSTDYTLFMITRVSKIELKPRTFQQISDWVLYAREVNSLTGKMRGVKLVRRINKGEAPAFVTKLNAVDGRYRMARDQGLEIELSDGQFSQTDCKDVNTLLYGSFDSYKTMLPFFSESGRSRGLSQSETPTLDMLDAGRRLPEKFRIEVASRFALALAPLIFFLVGAPLGVALDKRGRSAGFAISLLLIFFYYGLTISGLVLSRKYPALFPWVIFAPAVLAALGGIWLWKKRLVAR